MFVCTVYVYNIRHGNSDTAEMLLSTYSVSAPSPGKKLRSFSTAPTLMWQGN